MARSEQTSELTKALTLAQKKFQPIVKDVVNTYYGSKYAELSSVIEATQEALADQGLTVTHDFDSSVTDKTVTVITFLDHVSGQWRSNALTVPATAKAKDGNLKYDVQSISSNITYLRRIGYQAIIGVAAEQDDDGNAASTEQPPRPPQKPARPAASAQVILKTATPAPPVAANPPETASNSATPEEYKKFMSDLKEVASKISTENKIDRTIVNRSLITYVNEFTGSKDPQLKDIPTTTWKNLFETFGQAEIYSRIAGGKENTATV